MVITGSIIPISVPSKLAAGSLINVEFDANLLDTRRWATDLWYGKLEVTGNGMRADSLFSGYGDEIGFDSRALKTSLGYMPASAVTITVKLFAQDRGVWHIGTPNPYGDKVLVLTKTYTVQVDSSGSGDGGDGGDGDGGDGDGGGDGGGDTPVSALYGDIMSDKIPEQLVVGEKIALKIDAELSYTGPSIIGAWKGKLKVTGNGYSDTETFSGTGSPIGFDRLLMPTYYLGRMPNKKVGVTVELWGEKLPRGFLSQDWVKVKTETFSIEPVYSGDIDGDDGDGGDGGDGGDSISDILKDALKKAIGTTPDTTKPDTTYTIDTTPDETDEVLAYFKYGAIALGGLAVIAMMIPLIGRRSNG